MIPGKLLPLFRTHPSGLWFVTETRQTTFVLGQLPVKFHWWEFWKETEKRGERTDFLFVCLIPVSLSITPAIIFHSGCSYWLHQQQLVPVFRGFLPTLSNTLIRPLNRHQLEPGSTLSSEDWILTWEKGASQSSWVCVLSSEIQVPAQRALLVHVSKS